MEQEESSEFAAGYGHCSSKLFMLQNWPNPDKDSLQTRRRIQFCFIDDSNVQDDDDRKADLEEDRDSDREADREADRETEGESRSRKS